MINGQREKFIIYGNDYYTPDGTCIRGYIDVFDLRNAHIISFERLKDDNVSNVYNLGIGIGFSVKDMNNNVIGIKKKFKIIPPP